MKSRMEEFHEYAKKYGMNDTIAEFALWNALQDKEEECERLRQGFSHLANCPCCNENVKCVEDCTFEHDAPSDFEQLEYARDILNND